MHVQAKVQNKLRQFEAAVACLEEVLLLSLELEDTAGDVDTLGFLADLCVEMGDLSRAGKLYDRVLEGIAANKDDGAANPYMSWDC